MRGKGGVNNVHLNLLLYDNEMLKILTAIVLVPLCMQYEIIKNEVGIMSADCLKLRSTTT